MACLLLLLLYVQYACLTKLYESLVIDYQLKKGKIKKKMLQKNVVINGRVPEPMPGPKAAVNEVVNNNQKRVSFIEKGEV